jgi:hypothetical protein
MKRTRRTKARELIERLNRGPAFSLHASFGGLTAAYIPPKARSLIEAEMSRQYRGWIESWVQDDVLDLVPELRKGADEI